MKIINRKTFLTMPAGTIYAKFEPCIFGDICIKERSSTITDDWIYQDIIAAIDVHDSNEFGEVLCRAEKTGESIPMDFYCTSRDDCFDAEQLFAVWERQDVESLIERLVKTLHNK